MNERTSSVIADGLWRNNPGLTQLLGLCPLLAVTTTLANGLALGLATVAVVTASNVLISSLRRGIHAAIRLPVFVLVIASLVTSVDLFMNAYFHDIHRILGLFVPLIVTNCAIIGRAEAFASRQPVHLAALDGLATGTGFALVLVTLGGFREIVGQGTLFRGLGMLNGGGTDSLTVELPFDGLLVALLPPGAFVCLGLLLAAARWTNERRARTDHSDGSPATKTAVP